MNITLWLLHVNFLLKVTMKKSIGNIQLPNRPVKADSNAQNQSDSSRFYNWTKCFCEINSRLLMKSLGYQSCLVSGYCTITVKFQFINPFTPYQIEVIRRRNKNPCLLFLQSIKLSIHCLAPIWISRSYFVGRWFSEVIVKSGLVAEFRFGYTTLGPSLHGMRIDRNKRLG